MFVPLVIVPDAGVVKGLLTQFDINVRGHKKFKHLQRDRQGCISRTFFDLERARHVAAVITNLADEAHLVARMQDALSGQMNRPQEILRAAGNFANIARSRPSSAASAVHRRRWVTTRRRSSSTSAGS